MPALTHSHLPGDLHDRLQQLLDSARFGSPSETDGGLQQTAQPSGRTAGRQQTSAQPGATATSQTLSGSTAKRPGPETGTSAGRDVVIASRVDPSAAVAPRRGDGGRGGTVNETLSELRDG